MKFQHLQSTIFLKIGDFVFQLPGDVINDQENIVQANIVCD